MIELTRILTGSLVLLLMIEESYQIDLCPNYANSQTKIDMDDSSLTVCYDRYGTRMEEEDGDFCFDNTQHLCWSDLDPTRLATMDNNFYLFTREQQTGDTNKCLSSTEMFWHDGTFGDFSSSKETIVIIHGWRSRSDDEYLTAMCDAFMKLDDYNIIMVNWEEAANNIDYFESRLDSRLVAKELAVLLNKLHDQRELNYADVHLVGHSLGAHLAGYTGRFLSGQIKHITGLDPASPCFKTFLNDTECYLDKTDADFVDIIHSDGSAHLYGLEAPVGDQDFYPNEGCTMQPKCWFKVACSHMRAMDYYLSSMMNVDVQPGEDCSFTATPISPTTCSGDCPRMGIHAEKGNTGSFEITLEKDPCGCDFIL